MCWIIKTPVNRENPKKKSKNSSKVRSVLSALRVGFSDIYFYQMVKTFFTFEKYALSKRQIQTND